MIILALNNMKIFSDNIVCTGYIYIKRDLYSQWMNFNSMISPQTYNWCLHEINNAPRI